jgi:hypothetical protein
MYCGGKSRRDWRSGEGHAAHLRYRQHYPGHRWGSHFSSVLLSQICLDQLAHNSAASVCKYTVVSDHPWQKEYG